MAEIGLDGNLLRTSAVIVIAVLVPHFVFVSAEELSLKQDFTSKQNRSTQEVVLNYSTQILHLLSLKVQANYQHFWPEMKFGWRIIVGTVIGFFGAACGSVGGVGGGGIYVPMLTLIIGFDPKSSTAMSKCMITGAAIASVCYNLSLRHPTLELPLIDYDLALLFQPMLVLGISIGVDFNVIFADWMVPVLLVVLLLGTSTKAFFKGVGAWKKETITKKEAAKVCASKAGDYKEVESKSLHEGGTNNGAQKESNKAKGSKVPIIKNICWKELGILITIWGIILALQIVKNSTTICSAGYWVSNLLQIPVAIGATAYQAFRLYRGQRIIGSRGDTEEVTWRVHQLFIYCSCGIFAGLVGGLLGLGGGFILGPLFLEMGVPPQVSSATATFAMMFSSSMSVVEYNFLRHFPIPYALYFVVVATIAAFVGQHLMRRIVTILGRASLIIFVLAFTNFLSAFSLGGVGISDAVKKIEKKMYMGFGNICT